MNPVYDRTQKVHLVSREALRLFLEQWGILVYDVLVSHLDILLRSDLIRMNPRQPCQLLHIRGVVIRTQANLLGQFF